MAPSQWYTGILLLLFSGLVMSGVSAAVIDSSYVYGHPPSAGNIVLNFDNTGNDLDAVAIVTLGGNADPLYAIYIPAEDYGSIKSIGQGRFDIYFELGVDWDERNRIFQDGKFFKISTPVILKDNKDTYTVYLYDKEGKPKRIKEIAEDEMPDIRPRI